MVKRCFYLALCLALLLSACARAKTQPPQKEPVRDADSAALRSRSNALFEELEGGGRAPESQVRDGQASSNIRISKQTLPQAGETVVVEIDTFKVFNYGVSIREAESQTREMVRQLAMERALPADISLSTLSATMYVERNARFDESAAVGVFMMSSSAGRFLEEEFLRKEPVFDNKANSLVYRMHYRAKILPLERSYNPSMHLKLKLSETLLKDREDFTISLIPSVAGYLYFFDFLSDSSVALVYPNADYRDNYLRAGENWEQKLSAVCDPNSDYSIETLYFVFSMDPIAGWEDFRSNRNSQDFVFSAGEESFILFQNWLAKSNPMRRIEKMAQVNIFR